MGISYDKHSFNTLIWRQTAHWILKFRKWHR